MDLHLVVDVADVGVYGVRGDDELFRHGVGRVSARDEQQDLRFAGRQAELGCRFGADLLHLVSRGRRSGEGHDADNLLQKDPVVIFLIITSNGKISTFFTKISRSFNFLII